MRTATAVETLKTFIFWMGPAESCYTGWNINNLIRFENVCNTYICEWNA